MRNDQPASIHDITIALERSALQSSLADVRQLCELQRASPYPADLPLVTTHRSGNNNRWVLSSRRDVQIAYDGMASGMTSLYQVVKARS